jgi:uncharacterized protein involved in exopolysaccharide biosynthesis
VPSTSVIEIQANASEPAQTARTANAVAAAYKEHRFQQRRQSVSASLDALEARFADQSQKISHAQQLVDKLRVQLKIPDAVVSENMPTVLLSAETLRHIEALRIEAQAEHVKEKTLLENLRQLDPNDLPATILTVGIQDNQLASLSESLALVEQKLVSLQKELGPENTEYLKAAAQQEDLRRKIRTRTRGILMGLQAKVESTGEGLTALNDAVAHAQASDLEQANRSRPYFEAKRDLEELIRFRQILQTKIAMERTDIQLPEDRVEIVEEAVPPIQAIVPNRPRAFALLSMGLLLALTGWFLTRAGRPGIVVAKVS